MGTTARKLEMDRSAKLARGVNAALRSGPGRPRPASSSMHDLQRTIGNCGVQRMLRSSLRSGGALQAKLEISRPEDALEQEADHAAEQVMRKAPADVSSAALPVISRWDAALEQGPASQHAQRLCTDCDTESLQRDDATGAAFRGGDASSAAEAKVDAVRGGHPLSREQRAFFEPRFGADFSPVRIHTDGTADTAARAVGALAYTRGNDVVFRADQYRPDTLAGQRLLAHELAHVVQQGAAPGLQLRAANESSAALDQRVGVPGHVLQRWPGDGMGPPGDCAWGMYLGLRGAVESAKAVVNMLGACAAGDNCLTLAMKIAAISAEIAARLALDGSCFKGGDTGHRQQVQDKVNMLNRCYRFFAGANCPQQLVDAMEAVVARAREVIEAAALAVIVVAAVVALIAAIILLVKAIIAAGAGAVIAGAAAAVTAALMLIIEQLSPESAPPTA